MKRKLRGLKRTAVELDFDLYRREVPMAGVPGDRISAIDIQPEGVDRTIMLVHGYAGCAETWEHQINALSKKYHVVVPDLRGHGQSDAPYSRYTMEELVADLYAVSKTLSFPEKFVLVGHSFGGSICVEYANRYPEQLEKLILIATAGEYPLNKMANILYRLPEAFYKPWWKYRTRWNAEIHSLKRMMINNMRLWQGWSLLRDIKVPTMVITGERDTYFPRYAFDDVGVMVPGAEVIDIGASKHKVQLERHEAVNRAVERFIDEDNKAGGWRSLEDEAGLKQTRPWLDAYSDGTPYTVPIPQRPLHDFLYSAADWFPNRKATLFYGSGLTYGKLAAKVNQLAHALHGFGVGPGERVMIVLPNMPEFIISYYAALVLGGVVVLSNPDVNLDQLIRQAKKTNARVLITIDELDNLAQAIVAAAGIPELILVELEDKIPEKAREGIKARWKADDQMPNDGLTNSDNYVLMSEIMANAPITRPEINVDPDALAAILFTSGTTSDPKGVCLSHANLVANAIQTRHWVPDLQYGREVFLSVVPLLHSYGMTAGMNLPIVAGATMILLPAFDPGQVMDQIKRFRPTVFMAVPAMYGALTQVPNARSYGLSSIKACISGSAPLPVEIQEAFEKLTHGRLVEGYGLTEASPATHANPLYGRRKAGSIGIPLPNTDAKIVDLVDSRPVDTGQVGKLLVKGPQIMIGYHDQPSDTRALLEDGWLDTGDVGLMDNDGYFSIIGRTGDVIRSGDHTIYPRDIEELLYEISDVREVVVVGIPEKSTEQKVKAFVVLRQSSDTSPEELLELCRRRLEPYAVPAEIEIMDELPKTFSGKIIRRLLTAET